MFWLLCPNPTASGAPVTHCFVGEGAAPLPMASTPITVSWDSALWDKSLLLQNSPSGGKCHSNLGFCPLGATQRRLPSFSEVPCALPQFFPPPPPPAASQGRDPSTEELVGPQPWRQQLLSGGCQLCPHAVLSDGRSHLLPALSTGCCCCCYRNTQLLTLTSFLLSLFSSSFQTLKASSEFPHDSKEDPMGSSARSLPRHRVLAVTGCADPSLPHGERSLETPPAFQELS